MSALGSISDKLSNNFQLSQNWIFSITTSELLQYLKSRRLYQTPFHSCTDSNNVGITFLCLCSISFLSNTLWGDTRGGAIWPWRPRLWAPYCPTPGRPRGGWENQSALGALQMDRSWDQKIEGIGLDEGKGEREDALWCLEASICSAESSQWHQWLRLVQK